MIFRQLFDAESSTYTYLIADPGSREAALIDPVKEQHERDLQLLSELNLTLKYSLETHVHADHVTASGLLRERLGCQTGLSSSGGAQCADLQLKDGDTLHLGDLALQVLSTPGHTDGCVSYRVQDRVFTGDALLIRGTGRTDFQQGDAGRLYDSVTRRLFTLPEETLVYPGHDYKGRTCSSIGEEKHHNPRLAGKTRDQFIHIMNNLNLAQPKRIQEAVPANLHCGLQVQPPGSLEQLLQGSERMPSGYHELSPLALQPHASQVRLIDVREVPEFNDALGHIKGAELVPLGTLDRAARGWNPDEPLVLICRSGRRSITGGEFLVTRGFKHVFNLTGGMMAWNQVGYPVEGH